LFCWIHRIIGVVASQRTIGLGEDPGSCVNIGGCILVSGALDANARASNLLGIITGILSGLAYAIYTLMGRKAS
jgi:drug/metabolite transporter (DMT)-like permease